MWCPCRRPVFSPVRVHVVNTPVLGTMLTLPVANVRENNQLPLCSTMIKCV